MPEIFSQDFSVTALSEAIQWNSLGFLFGVNKGSINLREWERVLRVNVHWLRLKILGNLICMEKHSRVLDQ